MELNLPNLENVSIMKKIYFEKQNYRSTVVKWSENAIFFSHCFIEDMQTMHKTEKPKKKK